MKKLVPVFLSTIAALACSGCGNDGVGPVPPENRAWTCLGLGSETITAIAIDPTNPDILYAGSMSDFSAGTPGRLFKTTNAGESWDTLLTGTNDKYTSVIIDPANPQTIYAAPWGIVKSTDGGRTWGESDAGIRLDLETHVCAIEIDPSHSGILYTGTGGPYGGYFYKSTDAGNSWVRKGDSLVDGIISIAIVSSNGDIIYAGTAGRGILWKSSDAGENWVKAPLGNASPSVEAPTGIRAISVDQEVPQKVYVGLGPNSGPFDVFPLWGLLETEDGGTTWQSVNEGLSQGSGVMKIALQNNTGAIYVVSTFPYISPVPTKDSVGGIFERNDFGPLEKIGIDSLFDYHYSDLKISPDGKYLYFAGKGVFRSTLQ